MIFTIFIFIALLSVLIFVHELGHFLAARRSGMTVEEFGFGFPPRLWGFRRKADGTLYSINWIPLGGFVRIKGESGLTEDAAAPDSFAAKGILPRAFVVSAGVLMNIAFAWLLLTVGFTVGLPQVIEGEDDYRRVADEQVHVYELVPGSPAAAAGLQPGDTVVAMNGEPLATIADVVAYTSVREGQSIDVAYRRGAETLSAVMTPRMLEETGRVGLGVALFETGLVSYPWHVAPVEGIKATFSFLYQIAASLLGFFRDLIVSQQVGQDLSGPVGIAFLTGEVASLGFRYLLQFAALLSLNLAVVNFLPLPALDGGRMAFLLYEVIRGKTAGRRVEGWTHSLGFAFLMLIVVVVTYRDLVRYGDRIMQSLSALVGLN
jgi:regulator of sigma E protease